MPDQTSQAQQINILLQTLQANIQTSANAINSTLRDQTSIMSQMSSNVKQIEQSVSRINENFNRTSEIISAISDIKIDFLSKTSTENISQNLGKVADSAETTNETINSIIVSNNELNKNMLQNFNSIKNNLENNLSSSIQNMHDQKDILEEQNDSYNRFTSAMKKLTHSLRDLPFVGSKIGEILDDMLGSVLSGINSALSIVKSAISLVTDFVKLTFTLPFSILSRANEIGKEFRKILIEGIGQTLEDFKEKFDLSSYIGKSIKSMVNQSVTIMKQFEDPANDMVKLFGFREEGMKAYIQELATTITAMGSYAEIFAGTFRNNQKNYKQFILLKREMSYQDEDISYFAMDAAVNLKGLNQRIFEASSATNAIAKEYNIDQKMLSKNFMMLRKDVILFGHLSDEELNNTAAVMTRLKVKMEDAVAVFNKFSTFEDAANSVAILSQTFGMNLNALDIIKAEKPEEIFSMFRNAMLDTGRTFDDLSRFEKSIMTQQTGMSAESLKAMMNYTASGLTFDEARKKMEESSPEKQQIKTLKELQSAIKELKKVLEFDSPFDAIFKGLAGNLAYDKDTRNMFMMISGNYETIYKYFLNMPSEQISKIIDPLLVIVDIMKEIFASPQFIDTIKVLLNGFGNLLTYAFNLQDDINLKNIKSEFQNQMSDLKKENKEIKYNELIKILYKNVPKDKKIISDSQSKTKELNVLLKILDGTKKLDEKQKINIYRELIRQQQQNITENATQNATKSLNIASQNLTPALEKYSELSKTITGALIRGAMLGITALLTVINDSVKGFDINAGGVSLFSRLTGISDTELKKMFDGLATALNSLFTVDNMMKGFKITGIVMDAILDSFMGLFKFLASIMWAALKEVISGGKDKADLGKIERQNKNLPESVRLLSGEKENASPAPTQTSAKLVADVASGNIPAKKEKTSNGYGTRILRDGELNLNNNNISPMTILGKENKPVNFSTANGVVNYNSGFVSMILEKSNMLIDDIKNVDNSMRDFYDSTSNVDLSKKNLLKQKIEELSAKLSDKSKENNEESIIIKPEIDRDGIRQLAKALIGDNFAQMLTMPHLTQGVASINSSILSSPTLNTGEFNAAHTYSYNKG